MMMRKWKSYEVVEAEPITEIGVVPAKDGGNFLRIASGERVDLPNDFLARGSPAIGDYLVRYADGYLSWSPKAAFEDGYTVYDPLALELDALELGAAVRRAGLQGP